MAQSSYSRMFPQFKSYSRLNSLTDPVDTPFYDVEFYPFCEPGIDPVFAVVGGPEAIVCRPAAGDTGSIEVIAWIHDEDPNASLNSVTWSQQRETGDALLIVSGTSPVIKVFDVKTKTLIRTLVGHGKILTSASMDKSVRFWSLDQADAAQPTMLICGGEGHKESILTFAFHPTGRFLLTGGMDHMINLWLIPELPDARTGTDHPTMIYYPHFSTGAIHTDYVDCVQWHGDLILSKCPRESKVVLWAIEGFSSRDKLPVPFHPPTTHEFRPTRSAWNGTFQRLLEFNNPDCDLFFVRFNLYTGPPYRKEPGTAYTSPYGPATPAADAGNSKADSTTNGTDDAIRPLLAVGNERSRISFWDLTRIASEDGTEEEPQPARGRKPKPKASGSLRGRRHGAGVAAFDGLAASSGGPVSTADSMMLPGAESLRGGAKADASETAGSTAATSTEQAQADVLLAAASSADGDDAMTGVVSTSQTAPGATAPGNSPAPLGDRQQSHSQSLGSLPPGRSPASHSPATKSPLRTLAPAPPGPRGEAGTANSASGSTPFASHTAASAASGPSGTGLAASAVSAAPAGAGTLGTPSTGASAPPATTSTLASTAGGADGSNANVNVNATTTVTEKPRSKNTPRSDPFTPLAAHRSFVVPKINFTIRQIAFSVGGEYMVAVGDQGVIALFQR